MTVRCCPGAVPRFRTFGHRLGTRSDQFREAVSSAAPETLRAMPEADREIDGGVGRENGAPLRAFAVNDPGVVDVGVDLAHDPDGAIRFADSGLRGRESEAKDVGHLAEA